MTTITIENGQALSRTKFKNLTDLQDYLFSIQKEKVLKSTDEIKIILDERLKEAEENPENFLTIDELKARIVRKNV